MKKQTMILKWKHNTQQSNANAEKKLREKDLTIQGKDGEITLLKSTIKDLETEIQRLIDMNNKGGMESAELNKLLSETERKLKEALAHIDSLENTLQKNQEAAQKENRRLNTEIDRLNNILKATNQDMAD